MNRGRAVGLDRRIFRILRQVVGNPEPRRLAGDEAVQRWPHRRIVEQRQRDAVLRRGVLGKFRVADKSAWTTGSSPVVRLLSQLLTESEAALQPVLTADALDHAAPQCSRAASAARPRLTNPASASTAAAGKPADTVGAQGAWPRAAGIGIAVFEQAIFQAEKSGLTALAIRALGRVAAERRIQLRGRCSRKGQYKGQRQTQIDCAFRCGHGRPPSHVGSDRSLSDETASRHGSWYGRGLEAVMFGRDEVLQDLHGRLVTAGINPLDPQVQAICDIVNAFYAEKTREVLEQMQAVLDKIAP
jgi:hypothetical protein